MINFAVAIFGPTGVGKTSLALELAKEKGEIISVDSMQVYKYMNIGTAKPSSEEIKEVRHHFIDIITPDIQFSVGDFKRRAQRLIPLIIKRKKIPFLVGGTGLYFSSLMSGMVDIPEINKSVKEYLILKCKKIGQSRMFSILERIDYKYSTRIHPNDTQRTLRALEIFFGTGKRFSDYLCQKNYKKDFKYITIGININRLKLYNAINNRVDEMIEKGFVDEVNLLKKMGYKQSDPGMNAIGYKEILEYLDNKISIDKAIENIKRNSRRYAKRQLTWFRKVDGVNWFENEDFNKIKQYIFDEIEKIKVEI
ncbi:MAG: tRNA (adenosine(37)-N6)-dimethylallyltransferase MiaA [Spirochaetes bacterium]|nr:tRNA (adenosine(37)-N6)-dimethylallyltransferase MiaA [Spirochaetota bacterium]